MRGPALGTPSAADTDGQAEQPVERRLGAAQAQSAVLDRRRSSASSSSLMAIVPQLFARGADPRDCDLANSKLPPSAAHWFGFDQQGCDYLANVVYGARNSLAIGLFSVIGVLVLGVIIGAIAGYYGGARRQPARPDHRHLLRDPADPRRHHPAEGRPVDRAARSSATGGWVRSRIALALFGWMTAMRLVRSQVIAVKSSDYVAAARAMGASNLRILTRHILPNAVAPVLVFSTITVGCPHRRRGDADLPRRRPAAAGHLVGAADRDRAVAAPHRARTWCSSRASSCP